MLNFAPAKVYCGQIIRDFKWWSERQKKCVKLLSLVYKNIFLKDGISKELMIQSKVFEYKSCGELYLLLQIH